MALVTHSELHLSAQSAGRTALRCGDEGAGAAIAAFER